MYDIHKAAVANRSSALQKDRNPCQIWAVASGKGGTGKSFLSSNMGACLAGLGKEVLLIDMDIGGANLHSFLGMPRPHRTLADFFQKRLPLKDLVTPTDIQGLSLVCGDIGALHHDPIRHSQKLKLIRHLRALDYDWVIVDLGAGSHVNILDLFLIADKKIVVTQPTIQAIENMYHFIQSALFRRLVLCFRSVRMRNIIGEIWKQRERYALKNLKDLVRFLKGLSPRIAEMVDRALADFQIHIIINQTRNNRDILVGHQVRSICRKVFGVPTYFIGHVEFEEAVTLCTNNRKVFWKTHALSRCARQIEQISRCLIEELPIIVQIGGE